MLKDAVWYRSGEDLHLMIEPESQIVLEDPKGCVEALLGLLREGTRDEDGIVAALADLPDPPDATEVRAAIEALDELRVLEDAATPDVLSESQAERYFSNLAFFNTFASLSRPAATYQRALLDTHVLFLGAGGLCSTVIQALAGAGIGQMTLLDSDRVEVRNFARQYLYTESDIGRPKVDRAAAWVRAFDSRINVRAVRRWISGPADLQDLLPEVDFVVHGIDQPNQIDDWVNEACVTAGVPFVRGGMLVRHAVYWSVDPGRSSCLACQKHESSVADEPGGVPVDMLTRLQRVNRGIGPIASMAGSMVALEALRYLTGFAAPLAAGKRRFADITTGAEVVRTWQRWPDCPVCRTVVPRQPALAQVGA